ncbi:MAG: response regulator [Opitutales bacterium]|nr:response regulator [Opitutales bacterium]
MPKVLVVDDAKGVHEMLRTLFETLNVEAAFAFSAIEAIGLFKKSSFDVVLTDVRMDKIDGITLTRKIRKLDPDSVVIVMTAYDRKDDILEALKLGAFDFFIKPFLVNEFTASLKRAFAERERRRRSRQSDDSSASEMAEELEALRVELEAREATLERREQEIQAAVDAGRSLGEDTQLETKAEVGRLREQLELAQRKLAEERAGFEKTQREFEERLLSMEVVGAGSGGRPAKSDEADYEEREAALAEREAMMAEREAFLEQSENALFEKGQMLQELETELDQRRDTMPSVSDGTESVLTAQEKAEVQRIKEDVEKRALELNEWESRLKKREKALAKNEALVRAREQYLETSQSILFEREEN